MSDHLVVFDCDGVLVDSETLSARVMRDMARELGVTIAGDTALAMIQGRKVAEWVAELGELAGRPVSDAFVSEFRGRCAAAFDRELLAVDGVDELLSGLDLAFCCASSAPLEKIRHVLGRTGLLRHLRPEHLYSAYEIGVWKPDPGLFLHAARAHGVPPERCAVVEDSTPDVRAGLRAGMTVFGYAPNAVAAFAEEDVTVFHSMRELPELLRRWHAALPSAATPAREVCR
ncbi:HAD-IA family hydrolase [Streptomyces buecherae]|uniref:HAD-IA family hydrolase n=1 Tax=Streptomyces buecherae TaxID=2763006 RepID=A0A7H8NGM7_9ACTN|nr:HAD-IA family hydrolase [Streptomyces buecherae]QKW53664.1 HAD-IA family hydrolase [Streptomyces buecherae]